jgi:hypothetical protein
MVNKVIAVYPGRFQPMGRHHAATFKWLQDKFGKENSYIVTSDKVEMPKSPLNFSEKATIASKYGFGDNIVRVKNPYKAEEVTSKYDPETTAIVFMVGKKDMEEDPRFKIGVKKDGTPGYFRKYEQGKKMQPFTKHGYLIVAPHVSLKTPDGQEMSGTSIRSVLSNPKSTPDEFKSIFGWYDPKIEKMIKSKFHMKEERISLMELLEEDLSHGLITLAIMGGVILSADIGTWMDDPNASILKGWFNNLKTAWKKFRFKREVLPIINKLKDDPEILDFLKQPQNIQIGNWKKLIAKKLNDKEMQYLDKIYKKYFL